MTKWVYTFGNGAAEGRADMTALLGGKGANLAEMSHLGLPVPPGFTITTEVCTAYFQNNNQHPDGLRPDVDEALETVSKLMGMGLGSPNNPLLFSVRSGAQASMPGMMDTVLNLGLNDETVVGLAARSGDERFAYDSYRRFIQMYADVVLGVAHYHFEDILEQFKEENDATLDTELSGEQWKEIARQYLAEVERRLGKPFPQDVSVQLWEAVGAVFRSWETPRAKTYRHIHAIPEDWGTAVNVQAMVFGNMGEDSATGVAFTRNPSTGEKSYYGEFLINAQGEDVVAGIRTPQSLTELGRKESGSRLASMETAMPDVFGQLCDVFEKLEAHFHDVQDVEFTVQQGKLWMLQTRKGKRTGAAALKIAVDMVGEKLISRDEALMRIEPASIDQLLHPTLDPDAPREVIGSGLPASPGAASGEVVFTADAAEAAVAAGRNVILVRTETSPEDIHGMHAAKGILTTRGGMTSHAAVVARGMGRPCVSGAGAIRVDITDRAFYAAGEKICEGEVITIDGSSGKVMLGLVPTVEPELTGDFSTLMEWADSARRMVIRANAETPEDAQTALHFGAEGIGLCRTEHMFFEADRITAVREMILADSVEKRERALARILPMQRQDFVDLFKMMRGRPVTIRLLDPPLHEFLPHTDADIADVAEATGIDPDLLRRRVEELREFNPMMGHRGCRLGITYPEIYEMQVRAIFEAAIAAGNATGTLVSPEIMIPLVAVKAELDMLKGRIDTMAKEICGESGQTIDYSVGTMIELPRAALQAGELAQSAAFFSFGTNDLTQTTFGISRDDSAQFLGHYIEKHLVPDDPFATLDQSGVGELIKIGVTRGRAANPDLKVGICGEHGGDPASIDFCEGAGLDYVSCSPYRVPIARLAAAQAIIRRNTSVS